MLPVNFDPKNPVCVKCGKKLKPRHIWRTIRMDKYAGKAKVYLCPCGANNTIFIPDNLKPGEQYTVSQKP